jgi:hypothetical protein
VSGFLKKVGADVRNWHIRQYGPATHHYFLLTAGINLIGTLAYAARIAGSEPGASLWFRAFQYVGVG